MSSLTANFEELLRRIKNGRDLGPASFEPIYYLIFSPREILDVKRALPAWMAKLRDDGWDARCFSVAGHVIEILRQAPMRRIWLAADRKAPLAWQKTNQSLSNALTNGSLQRRLEAQLEALQDTPNAILLVTDLEALHPYLRIGAIESQLTGRFHVPSIFFYPGERTGKYGLKFLTFYDEDGNYRSVHVGD
jgi:hypothetical protein